MQNNIQNQFSGSLHVKRTGSLNQQDLSNILIKMLFSVIFAFMMVLSANSFFYLIFTPIPVTTQVLTVILSVLFLGKRYAFLSQVIYVAAGLLGFPAFAGFKSGIIALAGPTGGYIIGFLAAAYTAGALYEKITGKDINMTEGGTKNVKQITLARFLSSFVCIFFIYLGGFIGLFIYLYSSLNNLPLTEIFYKAWKLGIEPFIMFDFIKAIIAIFFMKLIKGKNENN